MVKKVTLNLEETLFEKAKEKARREHRSLDEELNRWLAQYIETAGETERRSYDDLMARLSYAQAPGKLTRDELNER